MKGIVFACLLVAPGLACAYLDPGSGNALVYLVISLGGACVYFLKSAFYKVLSLFGKKVESSSVQNADVVLFSEGPAYWFTFKPLVEELLARKIPFQYLSLDVRDPGLTIDDPLMQSRFMGFGAAAYARVEQCRGKIFLSTTPNIGCEGYPLARPKNIGKMVFVSHMVSDISYLKKGSLDHYDVDMEVGPWCEPRLRKVEEKRGLKPKETYSVGLLYLDELMRGYAPKEGESDPLTVLVAPSWGIKGCLTVHGVQFVTDLLRAGFRVIFRPHPQSFVAEPELIARVLKENEHFPNFVLDKERDARIHMKEADILISDSSSFRFDFAFLTKRPVVTLQVPVGNLTSFEAGDLGGPWEIAVEPRLGVVVKPGEIGDLPALVRELASKPADQVEALYDELVVNHGTAAKNVVDWVENELKAK